ncbi:anti-sigma factor family protein [Streptomyces sp. NPDC092296]|uniref:anti-sigma factor family protein n=1 Tax=Streptomyces sp. NPDC092296 TaxID=3366012 RepID=UPI003807446B
MSAERYTGSRRSRSQQARPETEAAEERPQGSGALVALSNVGPGPGTDQPMEEHHLGERLAGFVDGELDHDARDRVQAHLATCPDCLAEAEDERAAKRLLAAAATPEPSALLMSRLLAVGGGGRDGGDPLGDRLRDGVGSIGGSRLDGGSFGRGGAVFGSGSLGAPVPPLPGYRPEGPGVVRRGDGSAMTRLRNAVAPPDRRPAGTAAERAVRPSAARGRRFAFAAAGAFSVAAVALTGFGGLGGVDGTPEEPFGTSVSPVAEIGSEDVSPLTIPLRAPVWAGYPVSVPGAGSLPAGPSPLTTVRAPIIH